jgi:ribose transport system substrate-binding protein
MEKRMPERPRSRRLIRVSALLAVVVAVIVVAASAATESGPPTSVKMKWGTFTLAPSIAQRIASGQQPRVVLSFLDPCTTGFTPGLEEGMNQAAKQFNVKAQLTGPCGGSTPKQIAQIETLVAAHKVDCLGVFGTGTADFTKPINEAIAAGVPVFTYGLDTPSNRLGFYGADLVGTTNALAKIVENWARTTHHTPKKILMFSSAPTITGQIVRMKDFKQLMSKAFPGVSFGPVVNVTFNPATWYSATATAYQANPDADFLYYGDESVAAGAKFIENSHLQGKVFAAGYNINPDIVKGIEQGVIVGTVGNGLVALGYDPTMACANFLRSGKLPPNSTLVPPEPVSSANVAKFKHLTHPL